MNLPLKSRYMEFPGIPIAVSPKFSAVLIVALIGLNFGLSAQPYHRVPDMTHLHDNVNRPVYLPGHSAPDNTRGTKKVHKRTFVIVFNNDSSIVARTNIEMLPNGFIMIVDKGDESFAIKPSHTKSIRLTSNNGKDLTGTPFEWGWIFRTNAGPIFTYSYYPTKKGKRIAAIQKNDGPVVLCTQDNLLEMIEPTSKAYSLAKNSQLEEAIRRYNAKNRKNRKKS